MFTPFLPFLFDSYNASFAFISSSFDRGLSSIQPRVVWPYGQSPCSGKLEKWIGVVIWRKMRNGR